ncbi:hypothetical protein [Flavobacterium phycosphaerae]|uniref:hypothetical protein n=1 Tax=Flavobacterium phycosphaerae TaxID=2697515 RepID=UPI001F221BE4|nr:hypothetical protein [Flavobacterium phycosphaerae]
MKKFSLLFLTLLLISCHPNVKKEDLAKLNGYWEIKQVEMANGEKKTIKSTKLLIILN